MNDVTESAHPSVEVLRTFGLGQLDAAVAATVEEHLSRCEACCRTVAAGGSDTFIELLRNARAVPLDVQATLAPEETPAQVGGVGRPAPSAGRPAPSATASPKTHSPSSSSGHHHCR